MRQQALLNLAAEIQTQTPFLLVDLSRIEANCRQLRQLFPQFDIYYAMKANSNDPVLQTVFAAGVGLEVASSAEFQQAYAITNDIDAIISSHPVKRPRFITELAEYGCDHYVFDTEEELEKIAAYTPQGSRVVLRLAVDSSGSEIPLSEKFGAEPGDAYDLFLKAKNCGLIPYGLAFHVGSQCRRLASWESALKLCHDVIEQWRPHGDIQLVNMGGGFPAQDRKSVPPISDIATTIQAAAKNYLDESVQLAIEPGRFVLEGSGILAASVIGRGRRGKRNWLHLDAGIYHGLFETTDALDYQLVFSGDATRPQREYAITGPTCDSMDTPFQRYPAPDLAVGERVYALNANAYTTAMSNRFNGFAPPETIFVKSVA